MLSRSHIFFLFTLVIFLTASCRKTQNKNTENIFADSLKQHLASRTFTSGAFSTSSEMRYENEVDAGAAAILLFGKTIVDTIDLSSSLFATSDSTVFYKKFVYSSHPEYPPPQGIIAGHGSEYYLWSKGNKVRAATFLPMFSDLLSSPAFHDSCILYWGLKPNNLVQAVYAMRFSVVTHTSDSLYLIDDETATDFSGYFDPPKKENSNYSFCKGSDRWIVDRHFTSQRRR
jgi:hypothetical protein